MVIALFVVAVGSSITCDVVTGDYGPLVRRRGFSLRSPELVHIVVSPCLVLLALAPVSPGLGWRHCEGHSVPGRCTRNSTMIFLFCFVLFVCENVVCLCARVCVVLSSLDPGVFCAIYHR